MATRLTTQRLFTTSSTFTARSTIIRRTMASSSTPATSEPRKFDFLVIVPDKAGARQRRLDARP